MNQANPTNIETLTADEAVDLLRRMPPRERLRVIARLLPETERELPERSLAEDREFNFKHTRMWELCGTLTVAEVEPEFVVGLDSAGQPVTNYAEHVDEVLYRKA